MPQPITKPLIASSNFLEFSYEIVTSTYYHASLCFMTTVQHVSHPKNFLGVIFTPPRKKWSTCMSLKRSVDSWEVLKDNIQDPIKTIREDSKPPNRILLSKPLFRPWKS